MPVTTPDPAVTPTTPVTPATPPAVAKVTRDRMKADLKKREARKEEFKGSLDDAHSAVADAWADVKSLTEAGEPCNLVVLTAAIDDQTAAVGNITAHGSRASLLSDDDTKALRDAHHRLTQAYSDLRTILEFGTGAPDLSALPVAIQNMDAAVSATAALKS